MKSSSNVELLDFHFMFATSFQRWSYRHIVKPHFFRFDAEDVHEGITSVGKALGRSALLRAVCRGLWNYRNPALEQTILGIHFTNPVGLTAGFDKNALLTDILPSVGFGFEEIGSVTGESCAGNPKPRLWRLPKSNALVINYGLKNDGCEAVAQRLTGRRFAFPIGTNIAKTNSANTVEVEAGVADYAKAFRTLADIGDYFTVNISCPNACGGEPFNDPVRLEALLTRLDTVPTKKPVFLKLTADLSTEELDALVRVAGNHRVHGFVLTNLTKRRERSEIVQEELAKVGKGGISGRPVAEASNRLIAHLYRTTGGRYVIIGVGGIFSAEDAYAKIRSGASLVELATGLIFEGPQVIGEINKGLVALLKRDGFTNIREAVGSSVKS